MPSIKLGNQIIDKNGEKIYIIAEIGQNHQGVIGIAKFLIEIAKKANCNCVKFQKSHLTTKFTASALNQEYNSQNSWGYTYGQHKKHLEFSDEQYLNLQKYCANLQIDFTASAMDEHSLEILDKMGVPFIKIGSGDANNYSLLRKAAKLKTPLVISTGMQSLKSVDKVVEIMNQFKKDNFALLHCVSAYPTAPEDCNLQMIQFLANRYPDIVIGYSGHETGIDISKAAVLSGAKIIERHLTFNKIQKGSDHKCSLEPDELINLVREIKLLKSNGYLKNTLPLPCTSILNILGKKPELELALKDVKQKEILPCEIPCKRKLGKSIVAAVDLKAGDFITESNIAIKVSEPNGIPAERYYDVIGLELTHNVEFDEPVLFYYLKC